MSQNSSPPDDGAIDGGQPTQNQEISSPQGVGSSLSDVGSQLSNASLPMATGVAPGWVVTPVSSGRAQRQESSFASKIIPPILGGLAAIPIALAILWYGFGKDLGSAGPTVARYVPAIVPRHLRGNSFREDGTFGGRNTDSLRIVDKFDDRGGVESASNVTRDSASTQRVQGDSEIDGVGSDTQVGSNTQPVQADSLRESIDECEAVQAKLKENWASADNEARQAMARDFYRSTLRLGEGVVSQKQSQLLAWKRDLDRWSQGFLSEPAYPRLLTLCLEGRIEGIPPHQVGGAVVLVESISVPEDTTGAWELTTNLSVNDVKVTLVVPEEVHRRFLSQPASEAKPTLLIGVWRKTENQTRWIETVYAAW